MGSICLDLLGNQCSGRMQISLQTTCVIHLVDAAVQTLAYIGWGIRKLPGQIEKRVHALVQGCIVSKEMRRQHVRADLCREDIAVNEFKAHDCLVKVYQVGRGCVDQRI